MTMNDVLPLYKDHTLSFFPRTQGQFLAISQLVVVKDDKPMIAIQIRTTQVDKRTVAVDVIVNLPKRINLYGQSVGFGFDREARAIQNAFDVISINTKMHRPTQILNTIGESLLANEIISSFIIEEIGA